MTLVFHEQQQQPHEKVVSAEGMWATAFDELSRRIRWCFTRQASHQRALTYLQGLMSGASRKNGWHIAEEVGATTPYAIQHLLDRAKWDCDEVRDTLRAYIWETFAAPQAVIVIDETGFLKKGRKSVGVQRQYSGTAGRIENCQIGVFLSYASLHGHTLLDRELYLPKSWTDDQGRCREAHVPAEVTFATKEEMVEAFGARWTVEQCFEEGKGEVGLDEYEVRSWHGWYRHITLSMLALAFLTVLRAHDEEDARKKSLSRRLRRQSQTRMTLFKPLCLLISQSWFPSVLPKFGGFSFVL